MQAQARLRRCLQKVKSLDFQEAVVSHLLKKPGVQASHGLPSSRLPSSSRKEGQGLGREAGLEGSGRKHRSRSEEPTPSSSEKLA
jgi:hypothetical protein